MLNKCEQSASKSSGTDLQQQLIVVNPLDGQLQVLRKTFVVAKLLRQLLQTLIE